jgi:2,3-bisphosphoglycerate-dependent phosphoglycerate mutase
LLYFINNNQDKIMKKIVLLRHGQSAWNKENRFTGWTNVDLAPQGGQEAKKAGKLMREAGLVFDTAYTSYLKRAVKTLDIVLEEMSLEWIPVQKSWRLNEKHYGSLQGLNKAETASKYGEEQVLLWRRSFDVAPAPLPANDERNPRFEPRYKEIPDNELPLTESLKTCIERTMPYWQKIIWPALKNSRQLLVVAHGNSLRGIIKYLKNISDEDIVSLNLPTGAPYVFEFDDNYNLAKDYFLGDPEEIKKQMEQVANQAGKK